MLNVIRREMMIDDDGEDYLIVKHMQAQGAKYDLHWAGSFYAGQEEMQSDHYEAVLVDYDLGERTGLEIICEANASGYPSPFILYTFGNTYPGSARSGGA